MNNYVLLYHFPDKKEDQEFRAYLEKEFPKNKVDQNDYFCYFGFAGRSLAEVEDKITDILNNFGIGIKEYVALYYTKNDRPDLINRSMLLGKDELLETDLQHISKDRHMTFVEDLLDAEYSK
ncbi:hypothetical protein BH23BAC1_BH23BAC1_34910 [soil metagenome]